MFFWTPYTFVRISLFFIAGILVGIYQPDSIRERVALVVFFGLLLLYGTLFFFNWKKANMGFVGLCSLFFAGFLNTLYHTDSRQPGHILNLKESIHTYEVVVTDQAEAKIKSWKTEAKVNAVYDGHTWRKNSGKVLLYFSKQDFAKPFSYGDRLLVKGSPQLLKGPANPGEFDYKRFLTFRKIYHQHFLRRESVQYVRNDPPSKVMEYSIRARVWAEGVLKKYIHGEHERAVALALILGVKDGLDNDLTHAYSSSGAMHVLAVSGLHVGIIYMILLFFLKPLKSATYGKWILAAMSVFILWSYAFITGLSPSVLRAVTMFSFLAMARPLSYRTNIYNTLAISAFCLLLWEPFLIMSVGFQLSFLAVIGIVYLQPVLFNLWIPDNIVFEKIWQITCVSVAAQTATFALGILYFHQFPVYFLVSNLFVIPGALLSLSLGILVLAVSVIDPVAFVVGKILNAILWLLNFLVFQVERLPYSLIDNIHITTFQSWLLLGIAISVIALFQYRKFAYVVSLTACCLLFGGIQWQHHSAIASQPKFVVYEVNGHSAIELVDKGVSYFYTDSLLLNDRERMRFHIRPNRLLHGVHTIRANDNSIVRSYDGMRLYAWRNISVLHITGQSFTLPDGLEVDYLVLSNNAIKHMNKLSSVTFKKLIIDSSNSVYVARKVMEQAHDTGVDAYSVLQNGAFMEKL